MTLVAAQRKRLAAACLILLHLAASAFTVISLIEISPTALAIARQVESQHDIIFVAALVTAFIPFGCILFWGYKAIAAQVQYLFTVGQRYLMNHRARNVRSDS